MPCTASWASYLCTASTEGRCTSDLSKVAALRMVYTVGLSRKPFAGLSRAGIGLPAPNEGAREELTLLLPICAIKHARDTRFIA